MSSKSAKILLILVISIIAFCVASVFASMTGEISLQNDVNNTFNFTNDTNQDIPTEDTSYSSGGSDNSPSSDYSSSQSSGSESHGNENQNHGSDDSSSSDNEHQPSEDESDESSSSEDD